MKPETYLKFFLTIAYFCSRVCLLTPDAYEQKQKRLIIQYNIPQLLVEENGRIIQSERQNQKKIFSKDNYLPGRFNRGKLIPLLVAVPVSYFAYLGHYIDPPKLS